MRRMMLALVLSGLATILVTGTVAAASVSATPTGDGVVVVGTLESPVHGEQDQTITAGLGEGEAGFVGGLCAEGDIHTSCTPANTPD